MIGRGAMNRLKLAFQLLASAALMWLLLSQTGIEQVAAKLVIERPSAALAALALLSVQLAICAARWRMVCAALGVPVPGPRVTLGWVGLGFALSQVLPSSIGGDGYRIVALARQAGLGDATRTVVADRVAGLLTLSAVALPASLAAAAYSVRPSVHTLFGLAAAGVFLGGMFAGVLAQFLARWTASRLVRLVATDFGRMYARATLLPVFGISLSIHALSMGIVVSIGAALGLDDIAWWQTALVVPGTLLALAIPLSLGGWGIRESSMVLAFGAFGISQSSALALSIAYGLALTAAAGIGVVFWILGSQR